MSKIERLAELARKTAIEEWVWQGSYFVRRKNGDPIAELTYTYGSLEDAEFIAACNPAAIAQAATEYAAVVAERDALKVRKGELERLLLVAGCPANCIDGAYHGHDGEPVQCQFCYERSAALTPSPQSDQEEA